MHNDCFDLIPEIPSSPKVLKRNQANRIAKELGYKDAEDFKKCFVFGNGSKYNIVRDTDTGYIYLQKIEDCSVFEKTGEIIRR